MALWNDLCINNVLSGREWMWPSLRCLLVSWSSVSREENTVRTGSLEYQLQNRVENLADVSTRCSGLLQGLLLPEEGQSIWSRRRQGFQPCFEAGIRELPFLMPEPAEKPSLHSYLRERYGDSTQKLLREHKRSLHRREHSV